MKFTASRLSEGNKVFPAEITIDEHGATVRIPGIFGGQTTYLDFLNIGNVSISTPTVGYSTITFYASGSHVVAHGFTAGEVKRIKRAIDEGRSALGSRGGGKGGGDDREREFQAWKMRREQEHEREMAMRRESTHRNPILEMEAERQAYELRRDQMNDALERPWLYEKNFRDHKTIAAILFPDDASGIEQTVERIVHSAIQQVQGVLDEHHVTVMQHQLSDVEFWKPHDDEFKYVGAALEKARAGLRRLKRFPGQDGPAERLRNEDLTELIDTLGRKWLPLLEERRVRKRRKNIVVVVVMILVFAGMMTWLAARE